MSTQSITLYPSAEHCQRTADPLVPLAWAIAQLQTLQQAIPAEERDTATCTWPVRVCFEHTRTPIEEAQHRAEQAEQALQRARSLRPRDGESWDAERLAALEQLLG